MNVVQSSNWPDCGAVKIKHVLRINLQWRLRQGPTSKAVAWVDH